MAESHSQRKKPGRFFNGLQRGKVILREFVRPEALKLIEDSALADRGFCAAKSLGRVRKSPARQR